MDKVTGPNFFALASVLTTPTAVEKMGWIHEVFCRTFDSQDFEFRESTRYAMRYELCIRDPVQIDPCLIIMHYLHKERQIDFDLFVHQEKPEVKEILLCDLTSLHWGILAMTTFVWMKRLCLLKGQATYGYLTYNMGEYRVQKSPIQSTPSVFIIKADPLLNQEQFEPMKELAESLSNYEKVVVAEKETEAKFPPAYQAEIKVQREQSAHLGGQKRLIEKIEEDSMSDLVYRFLDEGVKPWTKEDIRRDLLVCQRCHLADTLWTCTQCDAICYCQLCYQEMQQTSLNETCPRCYAPTFFYNITDA